MTGLKVWPFEWPTEISNLTEASRCGDAPVSCLRTTEQWVHSWCVRSGGQQSCAAWHEGKSEAQRLLSSIFSGFAISPSLQLCRIALRGRAPFWKTQCSCRYWAVIVTWSLVSRYSLSGSAQAVSSHCSLLQVNLCDSDSVLFRQVLCYAWDQHMMNETVVAGRVCTWNTEDG